MKHKKRPTIGVVVLYYILGIGMVFLFASPLWFYLNRCETQGVVYKMETPTSYLKYSDSKGDEYTMTTDEEYRRGTLAVGAEVKVYYHKTDPKEVQIPAFEGNEPYLVRFILILMAVAVVFSKHRDYLKI